MMKPIGEGSFAEVFDLGDGRILKAFFDTPLSTAPTADPTLVPRVSFHAERDAYVRLQTCPELEIYVPRFFGEVDPRTYQLESKRSYSSACGLILERIEAEEFKFHELSPDARADVESVVERIRDETGVDHPWDGSCFIPGTRAPFTVIDFATPAERLYVLDEIVAKHGTVPPTSRRLFGFE